jgi:hypothetical protein
MQAGGSAVLYTGSGRGGGGRGERFHAPWGSTVFLGVLLHVSEAA